jgi:hypothetical protein
VRAEAKSSNCFNFGWFSVLGKRLHNVKRDDILPENSHLPRALAHPSWVEEHGPRHATRNHTNGAVILSAQADDCPPARRAVSAQMSLDVQISCSAFFPGETLYIKIDVETIDEPISWIALQLQGLCGIDSARVSKHALPSVSPILDPKLVQKPASSTSFPALPIPSKGALVIQVDSSSSSLPDLSRFPDLHFCFFYTPLTILSADIPAHSTRTVRDVIRVEQHSASFSK